MTKYAYDPNHSNKKVGPWTFSPRDEGVFIWHEKDWKPGISSLYIREFHDVYTLESTPLTISELTVISGPFPTLESTQAAYLIVMAAR